MAKVRDQLQWEAHQINYRLRSTFFYRKLKEYNILALLSLLVRILPVEQLYDWTERANWGIEEDAFSYITNHKELKLIQVFCHPKLLREYPTLIAYYRNIAALSQKSVNYLAGVDVTQYENDANNKRTLNDHQISVLVHLFNEHISLIIDSSVQSFTFQELQGLLLASTGAQIDGAWRNAIGDEAEKVVQRLLIKESIKRDLLSAFITQRNAPIPYNEAVLDELISDMGKFRGIMLNNQTSMLFSSEPDVTLVGRQGETVGVIEIKGGADPAGALERYGAAKKSFEDALRTASQAKTILVASCITDEVRKRIKQDPTISIDFNLAEIMKEGKAYQDFVAYIFSLLE